MLSAEDKRLLMNHLALVTNVKDAAAVAIQTDDRQTLRGAAEHLVAASRQFVRQFHRLLGMDEADAEAICVGGANHEFLVISDPGRLAQIEADFRQDVSDRVLGRIEGQRLARLQRCSLCGMRGEYIWGPMTTP